MRHFRMKLPEKSILSAYFYAYACYGRQKFGKHPMPAAQRIGTLSGYSSAMRQLKRLADGHEHCVEEVTGMLDALQTAAEERFADLVALRAFTDAVGDCRHFLLNSQRSL